MTAEVAQHQLVSLEDYLAGELTADVRHEYLGGVVYAMAGGSNRHGAIVANLAGILANALRGRRCRAFGSDVKVRILREGDTRFYYPDAQVVCRQNSLEEQFQDEPAVVFEVLSESTRRTDEQEKRLAYCSIPSLHAYVLLEQNGPAAVLWRRTGHGFVREDYSGLEAVLQLPEVEVQVPLRDAYEGTLPTA